MSNDNPTPASYQELLELNQKYDEICFNIANRITGLEYLMGNFAEIVDDKSPHEGLYFVIMDIVDAMRRELGKAQDISAI